ncbi:hypothetical protein BpHYR1_031279 [Brachionus plicatilis]|uniref:Uncharacterized protein n=1 Tax=Brachionus plicatilis TaxID=10195 RepID=A0A3M7R7L0_BRAPC|nr:hypothetical protein BpHYR1_031279 [Brachionus plicatilis]
MSRMDSDAFLVASLFLTIVEIVEAAKPYFRDILFLAQRNKLVSRLVGLILGNGVSFSCLNEPELLCKRHPILLNGYFMGKNYYNQKEVF